MSEQPIKKSDLIEGDPIGEISKTFEEGLKRLIDYDKSLTDIAKTMSGQLKTSMNDNLKGIEAISKAEKQIEKLLQEKIATEKKIISLEKRKHTDAVKFMTEFLKNNLFFQIENFDVLRF